jgi:hypothetical protein
MAESRHPGEYPYLACGSVNVHLLNERFAAVIRAHWPQLVRDDGLPSTGMLAELAGIVEDYCQVAAREAVGEPGGGLVQLPAGRCYRTAGGAAIHAAGCPHPPPVCPPARPLPAGEPEG